MESSKVVPKPSQLEAAPEEEVNLRKLSYYPGENPFLHEHVVPIKKKLVRSGTSTSRWVNEKLETLDVRSFHHTMEEVDEEKFAKIYGDGLKGIYNLSKSALRVLIVLMALYEQEPLRGGYADIVEAFIYDGKINDKYKLDMSVKTFQRGLKELLAKNFIAARSPSQFWVNPAMFFRGDRVVFVQELRVKAKQAELEDPHTGKASPLLPQQVDPATGGDTSEPLRVEH